MRLSTALAALLACMLATSSAAADTFNDLDEAIDALKSGQKLVGRVSPDVAADAVRAAADADLGELVHLVEVAGKGKRNRAMAGTLMRRWVDDPESEKMCAILLLRLHRRSVFEAGKRVFEWIPTLREVLEQHEEAPPAFLLKLLAWHAPADDVRDILREWTEQDEPPVHFRSFVLELGRSFRPREVVTALLTADPPLDSFPAVNSALARFATDPKAARLMFDYLARGEASPALYRCLGSVRGKLRARIKKEILARLADESGENLAAVLVASIRLGIHEAVPRVIDLASSAEEAPKAAALRTLPAALKLSRQKPAKEYLNLRSRAADAIRSALNDEGDSLAAAISAAVVLGMDDDLDADALVGWAKDSEEDLVVRLAAVAAIPRYVPFDRPTADLLVKLLDHPQLSSPAHAALLSMAKVRFPKRSDVWKSWVSRHSFDTSEEEEEEDEEADQELSERQKARAKWREERERASREEREREKEEERKRKRRAKTGVSDS